MTQHTPKLAVTFPPGDMLQEKLEELGMPIKEFCLRCGKPEPTIHHVLKGRSAITPDMAILFEKVLKIPAHVWLDMQALHDEYQARQHHLDNLQDETNWVQCFPIDEMSRQGYMSSQAAASPLEKLNHLLDFFGLAKPSAWQRTYQGLIIDDKEQPLPLPQMPEAHALSAWLRYGENHLQTRPALPTFSKEQFKRILPAVRSLAHAGKAHCATELQALCHETGISLVYTPPLKEAPLHGTMRWLNHTPLIQLSDSLKHYDAFWLAFFQAIGHLLHHGKRLVFLQRRHEPRTQKENEAKAYAASCLIPDKLIQEILSKQLNEGNILDFCQQKKVHPAFVLGRLKHVHLMANIDTGQLIPDITFSDNTNKHESTKCD